VEGLSKRGQHSQSTDPPRVMSAAEWQSESMAYSEIGELLIRVFPFAGAAVG
jgi:hypothetical protein